jgi:hypothetical protein
MALSVGKPDVYSRLIETLLDQLEEGQGEAEPTAGSWKASIHNSALAFATRSATDDTLLQLNHVLGSGLLMPALALVDKGEGEGIRSGTALP